MTLQASDMGPFVASRPLPCRLQPNAALLAYYDLFRGSAKGRSSAEIQLERRRRIRDGNEPRLVSRDGLALYRAAWAAGELGVVVIAQGDSRSRCAADADE